MEAGYVECIFFLPLLVLAIIIYMPQIFSQLKLSTTLEARSAFSPGLCSTVFEVMRGEISTAPCRVPQVKEVLNVPSSRVSLHLYRSWNKITLKSHQCGQCWQGFQNQLIKNTSKALPAVYLNWNHSCVWFADHLIVFYFSRKSVFWSFKI